MKLFLIRHGQTQANVDKIYAGQSDVPLTEEGRRQAERLRPILANIHFDRVYSSDLSRAIDTQKIALPGIQGIQTPLLREISVGSIAGLPYGCVPGKEKGWNSALYADAYVEFGGESLAQISERLRKFLTELEADPCENVAAFAHNGVMGAVMRVILGPDINRGALYTDNCGINVFDFDGKRWRLFAWNYMGKV